MSRQSRFRVVLVGGLTPYVLFLLSGMDPITALFLTVATLLITLSAVLVFVADPPGQDPAGPFLRYLIAEFRRWPWTVPPAARRVSAIGGILGLVVMAVALAFSLQNARWFGFFFGLSLAPPMISITWYFGWFESLAGQNESGAQPLT